MDIQEETSGSTVVVAPSGRVDGFTSPELEKRISEIIERGDHRVLLDCANMDYISSAGLRVVLVSAKKCQQQGGKLSVCALQPSCKSVMEVSGFLNMLEYHDTRDAALAAG